MGGKSRIGKEIAAIVAPKGLWWEPFCGGLNVTKHLAASGHPGIISDAHPALIAMYQAVVSGWDPPLGLTREEWQAAKTLPDSDPLKAFAGFGCSVLGIWFQGYQGAPHTTWNNAAKGGFWMTQDRAKAARDNLLRDKSFLSANALACVSFFDVVPELGVDCLYCDPPYANTQGYSTGSFDHAAFWDLCQQWAALGSRVFVSELSCPVPHEAAWEKAMTLRAGHNKRAHQEKLFRILPKGNV